MRRYRTLLFEFVINDSVKNVAILFAVLIVVTWATRTAGQQATKTHLVVEVDIIFGKEKNIRGRSQWPQGLRRGSETARLLVLWVRIPPFT